MRLVPLFLSICLLINFQFESSASAAPLESVYTDITQAKCKKVKEDIEYEEAKCPGVGGYVLHSIYNDQRQWVTVFTPEGKEYDLTFPELISPGFSSLGNKAEWRVVKKGDKVIPKALIVRFNVTIQSGDKPRESSYLVVSKITQENICVTDKIPSNPNANAQARLAADDSENKPCLKPARGDQSINEY